MNPDTGHLVKLPPELEKFYQELGYEPVPKELEPAAEKKLAGKPEAYVSLTSGGKLSSWGAGRRKARRKMARASRRRNRVV